VSEWGPDASGERHASTLSDFILSHRDAIIARWVAEVKLSNERARHTRETVLRDQLPHVLERLAARTRGKASDTEVRESSEVREHALDRASRGFDLETVAEEYAVLRTVILASYATASGSHIRVGEVLALNAAIDDVLRASVRTYSQMRDRILSALETISSAALGAPGTDVLLPRLLAAITKGIEAVSSVAILLLENGRLRVRAAVGLIAERDASFSLRVGEGFSGGIAATRRDLLLHDASTDPLVVSRFIGERGIHALYGVPLLDANDQLIGVAHMGSTTAYDFSNQDMLLFRLMATRAGLLLGEAQLRAMKNAADEALRFEHERYRAVIQAADDLGQGLVIARGYAYEFVNDAFAKLTGYSREELLGFADGRVLLMPGADATPAAAVRAGQATHLKTTIRNKGGEPVHIEVASKGIERERRVILVRDITERARDREQLQQAIEFRDRVVGILSHDIRNPLAAIRAATAVLAKLPATPESERCVSSIDRASARIGQMLAGLLDFTRARFGGELPLTFEPCDLRDVSARIVEEIRAAHPKADITTKLEGNLSGNWDPVRLGQALSNLLVNAIKHGAPERPISLQAIDLGESVELSVTNEGPPIPEDIKAVLFQPFSRAKAYARSGAAGDGFGLGLYIVAQVARGHGGQVTVSSTTEHGTTFTVVLPRRARRR